MIRRWCDKCKKEIINDLEGPFQVICPNGRSLGNTHFDVCNDCRLKVFDFMRTVEKKEERLKKTKKHIRH